MNRPRLLDLFCKAGGAGTGYHRAGFEVVGVDIEPQPHYPFEFHQADAMVFPLDGFDAIHASPPCHDKTTLRHISGDDGTGWILAATINRLDASGLPYVVENVVGARADMGDRWVSLCGASFGLRTHTNQHGDVWLKRHRLFASNVGLLVPECRCRGKRIIGVYGHGDGGGRGWKGSFVNRKAVMGIDWMTRAELSQAIPPAYTEWIGQQLMEHIGAVA